MVSVAIAQSDLQFAQILALQRRYSRRALSADQQDNEGFVYAQHDLSLLRKMASELPQAIALADDRVVGYCLALALSLRREQPMLEPMFAQFDQCRYAGRPLRSYRFFVGGQVCVDRAFRGHGLLGRLYREVRRSLPAPYELCVTEIAVRNRVSLRAHAKAGFRRVATYPDRDEKWAVVAWNLTDDAMGGHATANHFHE